MKIGPLNIDLKITWKDPYEDEPETVWCEICQTGHQKANKDESYEEWCIRVHHKPHLGKDGIDREHYTLTRAGYVKRKEARKGGK